MPVVFNSLSISTTPANAEINNDTFVTAPKYNLLFTYYTNTADDDLIVTVTNTYTPIGSPTPAINRTDFNIYQGQASAEYIEDELIGTTGETPTPAMFLVTATGNYWRNQMIKIEATPVDVPPPENPDYQCVVKLASGGANPVLFSSIPTSVPNPIPAGTRIYAPKILKTVNCQMYFASPIIKSGVYVATVTFTHPFSGEIIKTEEIIIRYSDTNANVSGAPKEFVQHQWGYVYKNLDYANSGRIILTYDLPSVFAKADSEFKITIYLSGFYDEARTNVINDSVSVSFTPKTNLNRLDQNALEKEIVRLK